MTGRVEVCIPADGGAIGCIKTNTRSPQKYFFGLGPGFRAELLFIVQVIGATSCSQEAPSCPPGVYADINEVALRGGGIAYRGTSL